MDFMATTNVIKVKEATRFPGNCRWFVVQVRSGNVCVKNRLTRFFIVPPLERTI